jgi:integrase
MITVETQLQNWLQAHSIGRKPRTKLFNLSIVAIFRKNWLNLDQSCAEISASSALEFSAKVAHYSPSRWNALVSILRQISPQHGKLVRRRPQSIRAFIPPSQAQFSALLTECDATEKTHAGLIIRFLALTGLRISEAMAVKWPNVFTDHIHVPAEAAKNGKARSIPRLEGLEEVLSRLRALGYGEFVLPRQNAKKAIGNACKRVGISPMSHHCFRHYFATRCIESGVDVPTVSRWLGHTDGGALLSRTYFHLLDEHSRRMAARVKIAA